MTLIGQVTKAIGNPGTGIRPAEKRNDEKAFQIDIQTEQD